MGWKNLGIGKCGENHYSVDFNGSLIGIFHYNDVTNKKPVVTIYRGDSDSKWTGLTPNGTITDEKYGTLSKVIDNKGIDILDSETIYTILTSEKNREALENNTYLKKVVALLEEEKKAVDE